MFWRLGYPSLLDPDEAHYAQLTREMLAARSWLVPLLDLAPFIDKPVLFHWLQGLAIRALGESEFAVRLPSALAALALFGTVRWVGTELFDRRVGEWGALMFATIPATFALASVGLLDMLYTAFLFSGVSCLLVAALKARARLQWPGYALIALAVMTKGPVALVLVVLFIGAVLLAGATCRRAFMRLRWGFGTGFVVVASSPWFVWMWLTFGDRFVQDYLVAGNLWYFTQPPSFSTRTTGYDFYLRVFAAGFFPWSLVTIGRALDALREWRKRTPISAEERVLWLWAFVVIAFFTAARFRLDFYIFSAAPACCILAAVGWQRVASEHAWSWTRVSVAVVAACFIIGGTAASVVFFRLGLDLDRTALALPIALVLGGGALLGQMAGRQWSVPRSAVAPLVTLLAAYATVVLVGFPVLERSRPAAPLGRWIAARASAETPVGLYRLEDSRASLRYYAKRRVVKLDGPDELQAFLTTWPDAYVVMLDQDIPRTNASLEIDAVAGRPAIVGRSGRYLRRQIWGTLTVCQRKDRRR